MLLLHGQPDLLFCQCLPPMQLACSGLLNGAEAERAPSTPSQSWGKHNVNNMGWLKVAASSLVMRAPWRLGASRLPSHRMHCASPPQTVPGVVPRPPMGIPSMPPLWAPEAHVPCSWPIPFDPCKWPRGSPLTTSCVATAQARAWLGVMGLRTPKPTLPPVTCGSLVHQINLHQTGHVAGTAAWP